MSILTDLQQLKAGSRFTFGSNNPYFTVTKIASQTSDFVEVNVIASDEPEENLTIQFYLECVLSKLCTISAYKVYNYSLKELPVGLEVDAKFPETKNGSVLEFAFRGISFSLDQINRDDSGVELVYKTTGAESLCILLCRNGESRVELYVPLPADWTDVDVFENIFRILPSYGTAPS